MILGVPAIDLHDVTAALYTSLARTVRGPFRLVIVDNGSERLYDPADYGRLPFPTDVVRYGRNVGFYAPLLDLWRAYPDALVALAHNDVVFHEPGWDLRMGAAFAADPQLGAVGLCGSNEIDERGGRGGGTMCFFRGSPGYQSQAAGLRITDLRPALVFDSLFMAFRAECVPLLEPGETPAGYETAESWADLPLAHFYDKIWPCRLVRQGWRCAVLGVEIDHAGGLTAVGMPRYTEDCRRWFRERGQDPADASLAMYQEAERRFFAEFGGSFFPAKVAADWTVRHA